MDRVLIFATKQTSVVLGKVFLLSVRDLAAHDQARTQLDGLRVYESASSRWDCILPLLLARSGLELRDRIRR